MNRPPPDSSGFTLLEMSFVLTIIALVAGSGAMMGQSMIESARLVNTNNKLAAIDAALVAYRMGNNRLPCPANATAAAGSASFGQELANPGTCTGANASYTTPIAINTNIAGSTTVVEGVVPVRALGLPDAFAYDGWGRKIGYAVWAPATQTQAFQNYKITPSCGAVTVKNAGGGNRSTSAEYALISYGPDGHGGYKSNGTRMSSGSTNTDQQTNCHCNSDLSAKLYTATYVQKEATQNPATSTDLFDDTVLYREHWTIPSSADTYKPIGSQCAPGFRADGSVSGGTGDYTGYAVAFADLNADGIQDLIISAPYSSEGGVAQNGSVYVVFGTASGFPNPLLLSSLNGTNGSRFDCISDSASSMDTGDINKDGITDLAIGGCAILFGHSGAWPAVFTDAQLGGSCGLAGQPACAAGRYPGVLLTADSAGWRGESTAVGDINGDGIADVLIGAPRQDASIYPPTGANTSDGIVYVLYGHTNPWPSSIDDGNFNGANGFYLYSDVASAGHVGQTMAAGDVAGHGGGIKDILIGAPAYNAGQGTIYVLFGHKNTDPAWSTLPGYPKVTLSSLIDGTHGIRLYASGATGGDGGGFGSGLGAGDINGDGIADVLIGAADGSMLDPAGQVFVLFGHTGAWANLDLTTLNGSNGGFVIIGGNNSGRGYSGFGWTFAAGDLNGDGIGDLVFTDPSDNTTGGAGNTSGACHVLYGHAGLAGWSNFNADALNIGGAYPNGFHAYGTSNDGAGQGVAVGDLTQVGRTALACGAANASYNGTAGGSASGSTYVLFGRNVWPAVFNLSTIQ